MQTPQLKMSYLPQAEVLTYKNQIRNLGKKQLRKTIRVLEECQFIPPIIVDKSNYVIAGENILAAAKEMGAEKLPTVCAENLSEAHARILRIALDRIAEEGEWSPEALSLELKEIELILPELDLTLTGFEVPQIDSLLSFNSDETDGDPISINEDAVAITKDGDIWQLGEHRLICGDSLKAETYAQLMGDEKAHMVTTDPPYNVKIDGHVGNSGKTQHREFLQASGEMNQGEFTNFLTAAHQHMAVICHMLMSSS